ncbi:Crp/Fnr family transcriptional regulator [Deinococcus peraridilitoris]|uniref:cAMP-binding protein n=1 Tax=Deinococcus peraridilitoris (strain DSM 19664 / LMG 22246 / CIP 109416 / KR-200) TaxID=937777 RepID=L0A7Y6_DEIPD|nr:Crp/Fnr family transcriptional regulator [Deinococcus peraridilitoris]AFZ69297.1 cAMP-binding protein [Deinococcus peraridilitoris DSM 19664]
MNVNEKLLTLLATSAQAARAPHVWTVIQPNWGEPLSGENRQLVHTICPPQPFKRGEYVFRRGDPAQHVRIILQGLVKLSVCDGNGEDQTLLLCGPGDIIGENYLIDATCCEADALCLSDTLMCLITHEKFLEMVACVPEAILRFAAVLAKHNADLQQRLRETAHCATTRVAWTFVDLARRFGTPGHSGLYRLRLGVSQADIAGLANTTRVTTTEVISQLREQNLLHGTRGRYLVDVTGLEQLLHGAPLETNETRPVTSLPT